jgi:hypothetical protein
MAVKKKVQVKPKARPKVNPKDAAEARFKKFLAQVPDGWDAKKGDRMVFLNNVGASAARNWFKPGDIVILNDDHEGEFDADDTCTVYDLRIEPGGGTNHRGGYYRRVMHPLTAAVEEDMRILGMNVNGEPLPLPEPPPPEPPPPDALPYEEVKDTGVSYARGGTMVRILQHFQACHPPQLYVQGYPEDHPAALVWEDVLLNKPNPKNQEVQAYWIRTMMQHIYGYGYADTILNEIPPNIRARRKTHGSDDLIVRQHMLKVMPWSRMEAKMVEDGKWKFTEAELNMPYNAAPTREQHNMPTMNQNLILTAVFNFFQNAANKHGIPALPQQEGFLENLEAMEAFAVKYGAKADVNFVVEGDIETRLTNLENLCINKAGVIGVAYVKPRTLATEANPAEAGVAPNDELFRMLVTRVTSLEKTLAELSKVLIENGFDGTDGE